MPNIKALRLQVKLSGREIFSNLNFSLKSGEGLRLLGPNGVGKTVLLQVLAGLLKPSSGALSVDLTGGHGRPVFLPYHGNYDGFLKVNEFLRCWGSAKGLDREIDTWQLEEMMGRRISHLSAGQFKRVLLASCMSLNSALLLLDEPTAGLDERFFEVLQLELKVRMEQGNMAMIATHQPELFEGERWSSLTLGGSS